MKKTKKEDKETEKIVDAELVRRTKSLASGRPTFALKYPLHGKGKYVPCENPECQKVMKIGDRVITLTCKINRCGVVGSRWFCSKECKKTGIEILSKPGPRPVFGH